MKIRSAAPQTDTANTSQDIKPVQIFLIEDDADDRLLARKELEDCAYIDTVATFQDGEELINYMNKQGFMDRSVILFSPLLILIDLEMPRKDGLQVIEELRHDPFLRAIPLIVITNSNCPEKLKKAKALGASSVFKKPLNKEMLNHFFEDAWQWPPEELW